MISARLHDYVVKAILDKLVRADAENVRFWHKADICNKQCSLCEELNVLCLSFRNCE